MALPAALAIGACGEDTSKGEAALARLQATRSPGFLRVVNLTDDVAKVTRKDGAPLFQSIPAGEFSVLVPLGTKEQRFALNGRPETAVLRSGEGVAMIALPGGKTESVSGLVRRPTDKANVWVVFAKGDGSLASPKAIMAENGGTKTSLGAANGTFTLPQGEYKVLGESVQVAPKMAYTFLFVPLKGKLRPFLMRNTPDDKPVGAGSSG